MLHLTLDRFGHPAPERNLMRENLMMEIGGIAITSYRSKPRGPAYEKPSTVSPSGSKTFSIGRFLVVDIFFVFDSASHSSQFPVGFALEVEDPASPARPGLRCVLQSL